MKSVGWHRRFPNQSMDGVIERKHFLRLAAQTAQCDRAALGLALAAGPERWTAMEGGVPIMTEGHCIGGVGVSGGDWQTDLRIAQAAVESIGASWK